MSFAQRSVHCGQIRLLQAGETVVLNGWAHKVRDLGGVCFVDMRDRTGLVQLFLDPAKHPAYADIRTETCLSITGVVRERTAETKNPNMPTGEVEIDVTSYQILNPCKPLPFPISDEAQMVSVNEELRVKHRYLDLRRPSMHRKFAIRASAVKRIRAYLDAREFLEIETPIFTKSTPEGARDYLVPYRLEPGLFYALPQSPQQYKQLLMVAGMERYYQIAKCFRDESQRADRQPEFTQLDLEMSFVTQEDILQLAEGLTVEVVNGLIEEFKLDKEPITGLTRLTYDESMQRYGCDKPDLRFGLELFDLTPIVRDSEFGVFRAVAEGGGLVRGVRFPGGSNLSRKEIGELENFCKELGAKGMATFQIDAEPKADHQGPVSKAGWGVRSPIAKFFTEDQIEAILAEAQAEPGDMLCLIAGHFAEGNNVLYRLRNEIGSRAGLRDPRKLAFCYVIDFPLVEWDADSQRWSPSHHPFTAPKHEDLPYLDTDPGRIRAECYDIVCNGTEWASGSIRIHRPDIQAKIFDMLGIDAETQQARFGHILEAFQFGAPPHGGIAPGIDRLCMFLTDDENIREVIAFPKMGQGYDPMMDAPSPIDPQQWAELGLRRST